MKYVALLRGINVGGKNKVAMSDLKASFEEVGFVDVRTYINSGNVIFDSPNTDVAGLVTMCETAIEKQFGFHIVCSVVSAEELQDALKHAPAWWDNGDAKHNAIFVIAPRTTDEIMAEVGEAKPEYENVTAHPPIIFWSAPIETFSRTRYSKIVGTNAYQFVTIRNANTTKKIAELCREA
ncbi:DUF1697 domain-containing protein [bacterium]|nr:MAG: DUF1697 domain-containing protein [bacterium]